MYQLKEVAMSKNLNASREGPVLFGTNKFSEEEAKMQEMPEWE
jgi:hypothetical protein